MSPHLSSASFLLHAGLLAATKAPAKTSTSPISFILIIVIFAGAYLLLIRPQRQRARRAQQNQQAVQIGDEVMLTSGIIGRVTWLEGDRARLEIAPNTEIEVLRAAIGRTIPTAVSDDEIAPHGDGDEPHLRDNPYVDPAEDATSAPTVAGHESASSAGEDEEGT